MNAVLRSLWDEPRPPDPPSRVWRDWALLGVLGLAVALEGLFRPDMPWRVLSVIVVAALVPTLLWRRTRPFPMFLASFGTTAVVMLLTGGAAPSAYAMAGLLLLPYSLARWGSGREIVLGLGIVLPETGLSVALGQKSVADAVGGLVVLFATVTLAAALRYRARARLRELDQAKLLERERLARDLHDTVAHHVSAMAIRAQAGLAMMPSQPEAAAEALHLIEAEAARALDEMRTMVRVLRRDEPADLAPNPRIDDLEKLASRTRPSVDVTVSGDLGDLPPQIGSAIYRLAQESVTNARRHARHVTRIEVRVTADDTSVRLRVSDDGEPGLVRPAASPGYGVAGMIERAGLLGGTCEAGPNPGRGWTVTAVLPRRGAAA
ncbi:sensor histidine kinase [Amycolatopsis vastitatis]|uniref:histidine kinase n=1 Tax=Amycolatopsis vastitatis TaxID=1905142 RepID=A0A229SZT4_9PSEU|nr:sensor histidine kinase [Amycolatopsis vastitatis]OXM64250.1 two-component sensor histidine kinase [Amycolatopsis vastitatis]